MINKDEIRENKENRTDRIQAASLHQSKIEHCRNKYGIYADSRSDYSFRSTWYDLGEYHCKKGCHHDKEQERKSFCLGCQFPVLLDFSQPSPDEEPDVEDMSQCKESHLREEIVARPEIVSQY